MLHWLLTLKMEGGAVSQGVQAPSRSWKRKRTSFSPIISRRNAHPGRVRPLGRLGAARGGGPGASHGCPLSPGCCARFSARSSLYIHAKKHLQDVAAPKSRCPVSSCDRLFASKHSMKAHVLRQHRRPPGGPLAAAGFPRLAWAVRALKRALTSPSVPSCPSSPSCPALPGTAMGTEQTVPG